MLNHTVTLGYLEVARRAEPRFGKQNFPRRIKVQPPLLTKPARRHLRNMQQTVAADADQFCSVPRKEASRRLADPSGIGQLSKAYRAPLPLIAQTPAQSKQTDRKGRHQLEVLRRNRVHPAA
jgi:hypothetical protein